MHTYMSHVYVNHVIYYPVHVTFLRYPMLTNTIQYVKLHMYMCAHAYTCMLHGCFHTYVFTCTDSSSGHESIGGNSLIEESTE